jgi:hypothetical protein
MRPTFESPLKVLVQCQPSLSVSGVLTCIPFLFFAFAPRLCSQVISAPQVNPIAIVPLDPGIPGSAASVVGASQVSGGKAIIVGSGTITSGPNTADVVLPNRGQLHVCASTSIKLAANSGVPAGETPGLMMAMDHGAIEASFSTGRNADTLITPDFRILIGGPGPALVKVRLGQHGDTCIDNPGANAPYVLVSSIFDNHDYRVQAGQRVMFEHGSLHEVVDHEKEPCGCPPSSTPGINDFPLAVSEGLAPGAGQPLAAPASGDATSGALSYNGTDQAQAGASADPDAKSVHKPKKHKKHTGIAGVFESIAGFFKHLFGAE